jgi:DNA-binding winged helix-turn-helix (wHTH) protein/Tol biopolymer transport system component
MAAANHCVFRFCDVEVREAERRVTRGGEPLTLEPKTYRVLIHLLHHSGHLVTKNELLDAVWGDTTVTESSLTRAVALLRHVLEDDPHQPRFIETVATAGYRFVCPVEVSEDSHDSVASTGSANAGDRSQGEILPAKSQDGIRQKSRRRWLFAAPVLAAVIAATIWYLHRPLPPPRITGYIQITHDGHRKYLAGTDSNRLYFNDSLGEATPGSIAQVAVSGGLIGQISVPLPSPILVDVSPDGANLLVISVPKSDEFSNPLWNVRIFGGSVRRLGDANWASFSPDGNSVAFTKAKDEIWLVQSDGTGARKLATVGGLPCCIVWSPDGSVIRFTQEGELWEMSSTGLNPHRLLAGWHASAWRCCGGWTRDGKFFLFLSEYQIWALDERRGLFRRPSDTPIQLAGGPINWGRPIPSKDGSKIFAEGDILRGELSRFDSKTKQFLPFLGGISVQEVIFSKDGKSVAYVSYPGDILWKANRDGSHPVQLTDSPMGAFLPRWSPDGTQIVFAGWSPAIDKGASHIYIVPSEGGSPPKLLPEIRDLTTIHSNWSPEGHKIVFNARSNAGPVNQFEKGTYDVRILDLDSHRVAIVPGSTDIWGPRWSPDGRYLVAGTLDEMRLMIFDFKTQKWSELPQEGVVDSPEWSRDGQSIYFRRPRGDMGVFRISIKGGKAEKIVDLTDWHDAGVAGKYMGLDPSDAPLLLRDIGSYEIYALTLEKK